jgi:hypothetical protein
MRLRYRFLLLVSLIPASVSFGQYPYYHRDRGTVLGGLVGAVAGGVIGENNDEPAAGAAIGAAVGALSGAALGDTVDNDIAWRRAAHQQRVASRLARAVSVHDVIAMTQSGLSDGVIVNHVRANGVVSRPQPTDLITMSNGGVSDAVMQAMQTAPLAGATSISPPVYGNGVIVERHHYVAPSYPVWHHWHHHHHCVRPYHRRPGVHWHFSFGR